MIFHEHTKLATLVLLYCSNENNFGSHLIRTKQTTETDQFEVFKSGVVQYFLQTICLYVSLGYVELEYI